MTRVGSRGTAGSRLGRGAKPPANPADGEAAYAAAVRILARQPQSRVGLEARLGRAGYTEEAARAAADRAVEHGYLDDQEYARSLVRRRSAGRGQALIARELRAKGIDDITVTDALDQVSDRRVTPAHWLPGAAGNGRSQAEPEGVFQWNYPQGAPRTVRRVGGGPAV